MPVIPVGFAQVTHIFDGANLPNGGAIVYGIQNDASLDATAVAAICGDLFHDTLLTQLTADVSLVRTDVKLGPNETGTIGSSTAGAGAGSQSNNSMGPNTAILVTKSSAIGGRRGRGRMFLPGVDSDSVDDTGNLLTAFLSDTQDQADLFLEGLNSNDVGMHLLHDFAYTWVINDNGQPRRVPSSTPPPFPNVVTALTVQSLVATQRRRLR
jgi:hypothetical protein